MDKQDLKTLREIGALIPCASGGTFEHDPPDAILHHAKNIISKIVWHSGDIKTLAHALIEEHSSNGNHFVSPDTQTMLRGICDFDEEPLDALKRLASINNQKKSCNHG